MTALKFTLTFLTHEGHTTVQVGLLRWEHSGSSTAPSLLSYDAGRHLRFPLFAHPPGTRPHRPSLASGRSPLHRLGSRTKPHLKGESNLEQNKNPARNLLPWEGMLLERTLDGGQNCHPREGQPGGAPRVSVPSAILYKRDGAI